MDACPHVETASAPPLPKTTLIVDLLDLDQMIYRFNHTPDLGRILVDYGIPDPVESKRTKRRALGLPFAILTSHLGDLYVPHGSSIARFGVCATTSSYPLNTFSSGISRRRATSIASSRSASALMVALT